MLRFAIISLCLMLPKVGHSQTEIETLNLELQRQEKVKEETLQTDREVTRIVSEYERLVAKYQVDAQRFGQERTRLDSILSKRSEEFKQLSSFVVQTMDSLVSQSLNLESVNDIRRAYDDLKRTNKACRNDNTQESFRNLVLLGAELANTESKLQELVKTRKLPARFDPIYEKISSVNSSVAEVMKNVKAVVAYYSGVLEYPEPCSVFNSLDTILILSQVAIETNQVASDLESVSLSSFLKEAEIRRSFQRAETQLRRTIIGYEAKIIRSLREGHLSFSMRTSSSFLNDLRLMTSPFMKVEEVPLASRKAIEQQMESAAKRIADEFKQANLDTFEGQRRLLVIRAKVLHAKAYKINGMEVPENLTNDKEKFLTYCRNELKLPVAGRFVLQQTKTVDENIELDQKVGKAEELLQPLEKGLPL